MALVETEFTDRLATLTLNLPERRNALSIEMCNAISESLREIEARAGLRALLLCGAGKVFCAGADVEAVSGPHASEFLPAFEAMLEAVARCRLPTVAVIKGAALGGGLQLATVCDFRIAA